MKRLTRFLGIVLLCVGLNPKPDVKAQSLPSATTKDYAQWHTMSPAVMSDDGNWIAWTLTMQENNDTLWVKHRLNGKSKSVAFGSQPAFSGDHAWLAVRIGVSYAEQEKLTELVESARSIMSPEPAFFIMSLYAVGLSSQIGKNVLNLNFSGTYINSGEFMIHSSKSVPLPMGIYTRIRFF